MRNWQIRRKFGGFFGALFIVSEGRSYRVRYSSECVLGDRITQASARLSRPLHPSATDRYGV